MPKKSELCCVESVEDTTILRMKILWMHFCALLTEFDQTHIETAILSVIRRYEEVLGKNLPADDRLSSEEVEHLVNCLVFDYQEPYTPRNQRKIEPFPKILNIIHVGNKKLIAIVKAYWSEENDLNQDQPPDPRLTLQQRLNAANLGGMFSVQVLTDYELRNMIKDTAGIWQRINPDESSRHSLNLLREIRRGEVVY